MIQRREDFAEVDGSVGDFSSDPVGRSDDLAGAESASGEEGAADFRPVIATGLLVDARGATELAPGDHQRVVEHASLVEVGNKRTEPLVEQGRVRAHAAEVVAVKIPATEIESDAPGAGLDETAGEEKVLQVSRGAVADIFRIALAVAFANFGILVLEIEGHAQLAGGEQSECLLVELVEAFHHSGLVGIPAELVEGVQQSSALVEPGGGQGVEREILLAGAGWFEGAVREPEKAGFP